ncbi:exopolysaccharide biosynthesis protein [Aliiroseovarius sp. PTFE2010]|uniref:exopolysaccharide biosynthesis protein n=1 Tax=Aliiroseovarius sp. PTFE2010 TaxID=3417190 RepID=UPI003CEABAC4
MTTDAHTRRLRAITDVIGETRRVAQNRSHLSVGELVDSLGRLSHAAMLLVPALIVATPLSGIPGLSSVGGICIALISLQLLIGRDELWFPRWIRRLELGGDRLDAALAKIEKPAAWIDAKTERRARIMFRTPMLGIIHLMCLMCGAAMPFLELVPMTSSLLAIAVCFFSLAMMARDGLLAMAGIAFMGTAVSLLGTLVAGVI